MALIKCTECGQMISDKATKCPKCGCPTGKETGQRIEDISSNDIPVCYDEESRSNKWLYVIIAILVAAILVLGYLGWQSGLFSGLQEKNVGHQNRDLAEVATKTSENEGLLERQQLNRLSEKTKSAVRNTTEDIVRSNAVMTDGFYDYNGNITYKNNIYHFQMSLQVSGNEINGNYIVTNGENEWVELSGTLNRNGKALIREYKNGNPTSYYFEGYLKEKSFSGKYKTTKRRLVMSFYATSSD